MVYDPIRDCEVPSPANNTSQGNAWKENRTPGSEGNHYAFQPQHPGYGPAPPPAFNIDQRSPGPSRSLSGGLRGLLNEDDSRRNSEQRSSISSSATRPGDGDDMFTSSNAPRPSIHSILNVAQGPTPVSKSSSASSVPRSSPSNASPGPRNQYLDPNGLLTPVTPAAAVGARLSRSPHAMYPDGTSPRSNLQPLPHDYQSEASDPSSRRASGGAQRPMLPPQDIPQHYDYRNTPTLGHLPLRSPSVSVSPRAYQASLPPVFPSSRPGSSSASNPFAFQHAPSASPTRPDRVLSEEFSRPGSVGSLGSRRATMSERRNSQMSQPFSPGVAVKSPSPAVLTIPYEPRRISRPTALYKPIGPEELAEIKARGLTNNPLRRRKRKPLPSWSGPSSRLPNEGDSSYFPPQEDTSARAGSMSTAASVGRSSITPGPAYDRASGTPVDHHSAPSGRRNASGSHGEVSLKRPLDNDESGHDAVRRKVDAGAYAGNASTVAEHCESHPVWSYILLAYLTDNSRPNVGVENRELSPIIGLKKFNNWIKSVLIGKFAYRGRDRPVAHILDIGCGKGGDLNKWKQARIRLYVGLGEPFRLC